MSYLTDKLLPMEYLQSTLYDMSTFYFFILNKSVLCKIILHGSLQKFSLPFTYMMGPPEETIS